MADFTIVTPEMTNGTHYISIVDTPNNSDAADDYKLLMGFLMLSVTANMSR